MESLKTELKAINSVVEGISKDFRGFGISVDEAKAAMSDQEKSITDLKKAFTDLEIKMTKQGQYTAVTKDAVFCIPEVKGMFDAMRKNLEFKAMSVNDGPSGGYLVHPEYLTYVLTKVRDIDEIRANASVFTTGSSSFEIPVEGMDAGLSWVDETETRSETQNPTFKKVSIAIEEVQAKVRLTRTLIQDASFNIESYVTSALVDRFARGEGEAFVNGSGHKMPAGLLNSELDGVVGANLTMDLLMDATAAVPWGVDQYAKFFMNKRTEVALRKLKDTTGQYMWQPGLAAGMPSTLMGYPVAKCPSMPDTGTRIIFGDMKGYAIVDRTGMELIRDNISENLRNKNLVEYEFSTRLGGMVVQPEKLVTIGVS